MLIKVRATKEQVRMGVGSADQKFYDLSGALVWVNMVGRHI